MTDLFAKFSEEFNSRNIAGLGQLFDSDVKVAQVFSEEPDFKSSEELMNAYKNLFEVNPGVKCDLLESQINYSVGFGIFHFHGFKCGAQTWTSWNVKHDSGVYSEIKYLNNDKFGAS